ncbi:MAG: FAD-binding oxidoreductase, partial [Actinobacteria bacterium ATB1]|nr:FAD-binding oxidoreductase [Actinobacteria bacterium ATB1]
MQIRLSMPDAVREVPDSVRTRLVDALGRENVTSDEDALSEAGVDWWPLAIVWQNDGDQPSIPAVVARPGSTDEVSAVLSIADEARIPVTPFAGRSGVCGGSLPVCGGISLDLRRLDRIVEVDTTDLVVHVEAGVFGPALEDELSSHGMTVGHFPQSFDLATVGGWIACRGAGQFSNRYGKIEDMTFGMEVVTPGKIRRQFLGPRPPVGPDWNALVIGSEGIFGAITAAEL